MCLSQLEPIPVISALLLSTEEFECALPDEIMISLWYFKHPYVLVDEHKDAAKIYKWESFKLSVNSTFPK